MVEAVKALPREVQEIIELKVWDINVSDGFNRKISLNVMRMPAMAMNGQLVFESSIPAEDELIDAINEYNLT